MIQLLLLEHKQILEVLRPVGFTIEPTICLAIPVLQKRNSVLGSVHEFVVVLSPVKGIVLLAVHLARTDLTEAETLSADWPCHLAVLLAACVSVGA